MILADLLEQLRVEEAVASKKAVDNFSLTELTKDLHFYPDLHGEFTILAAQRSVQSKL